MNIVVRKTTCIFQVDKSEKLNYKDELLAVYQGSKIERERVDAFEADRYYKVSIVVHLYYLKFTSRQVKWTRVPDLVEKRKVLLRGGWAYVPSREQSSIVYQEFESHLAKDLMVRVAY